MIKGNVSGIEKDITKVMMRTPNGHKEGWEVRDASDRLIWGRQGTISSVPPISFRGGAGYLENYQFFGNTVQNGTHTPESPVDVNGVGVRTENLLDKDNFIDGGDFYPVGSLSSLVASSNTDILLIPCKPSTQYTVSRSKITKRFMICFTETADLAVGTPVYNLTGSAGYDPEQAYELSAQSSADSKYLLIYYAKHAGNDSSTAEEISASLASMMVNEGSTALPYEPYGYKIPISCGGVTTPIYLGQTQTVRRIKKYVFDGTQNVYSCVRTTDSRNYCCAFKFSDIGMTDIKDYDAPMASIDYPIFLSNRFVNKDSSKRAYYQDISASEMGANNLGGGGNRYIIFCVSGLTTAEEYTDWFTNNPTPLYYILAIPETDIVNEPLMKIRDYADALYSTSTGIMIPTVRGSNILSIGTTVQPSNVSITGHIKPTT